MSRLNQLKTKLKQGQVYRREDLANWSKSVDRHLGELLQEGILQKLSQGLYYFPKQSAIGKTPPDDKTLVQSFLKDHRFLLTSPNAYNSLGVGTSQLYNVRVVYNHKRHGEFTLGKRVFNFRIKPYFPAKLTPEFLLVDLINNLETLAEDKDEVLKKVALKVSEMNKKKLEFAIMEYGHAKTKKIFQPILQKLTVAYGS